MIRRGIPDALSLIPSSLRFLHSYGIGLPTLRRATENAALYRIAPERALIATGAISERDYYQCAAHWLGLSFSPEPPMIAPNLHAVPTPPGLDRMAKIVRDAGGLFHIAPDMAKATQLRSLVQAHPGLRERLIVTTPQANRSALEHAAREPLTFSARNSLFDTMPWASAHTVLSPVQSIALLLLAQFLVLAILVAPAALTLGLHLTFTTLFIACSGLRLWAALNVRPDERRPKAAWQAQERVADHDLPIYSVLVALYDEPAQVDDLVHALCALDWPRERLEIKLVCEADDEATIAAVNTALATPGRDHIRLVSVQQSQPRTKPKALNYALPLCRGDYLVIYDAEDRPEPGQLREAHAAFADGPDDLACLQAPLIVSNRHDGWLPRTFAVEYSALFDGLLPTLARHDLPLPLGGTSNHFKRAALVAAGGWDPFNVTEDADLGFRLARRGYRTATLTLPTYEAAPTRFRVWRNQRTRWFKGWMQTWLVHMRHPIRLTRELGAKGTLVFHLLTSGMILSALIHPLLLAFIGHGLYRTVTGDGAMLLSQPLFWLDLTSILFGYLAFALLALRTLPVRGFSDMRRTLWTIPLHWLALSVAAWRALLQLITRPHFWEKTPHEAPEVHAARRAARRGAAINGTTARSAKTSATADTEPAGSTLKAASLAHTISNSVAAGINRRKRFMGAIVPGPALPKP